MKLITLTLASLLVFAAVAATQENPDSNPPRLTATNLFEMEELAKKGADPNAAIGHARMLREGEDPATVAGTYFPLDAAIDSGQANLVKHFGLKQGKGHSIRKAAYGALSLVAVIV